jgi:hypothetical protein
VIVASTPDQHEQALHEVLEKLQSSGLVLNLEKCEFGKDSIQFLGHNVLVAAVEPLIDHVQAVQQFPQPQTRQELQRFLGMINFYRWFPSAAALVLMPLTDALSGSSGKNKAVSWTEEITTAFQAARDLL